MPEYDVIVVGGGPAGVYAALTAARQGLRVALFEEHGVIGWPRHDPGWLMECRFSQAVIKAVDGKVPWTRAEEYRVYQAESGELIEKSVPGGYLVRRDLLEKELAALAVKAGARIFLKTRVNKLIMNEGGAEGIETSSFSMPRVTGSIIICADGIRSAGGGLAEKEGLCQKGELKAGLSYVLARARVYPGIIEHYLSPDPQLNYRCFFSHREEAAYLGVHSEAAWQALVKRQDNAISAKIQEATPVEITGYARAAAGKYGDYFPRIVRNNVMFVGDASGGSGNIHGMIQGQLAGGVAAAALKENDLSEGRLREYQMQVMRTLGKAPFCWFSAREDFGTFKEWFRQFKEVTRGIDASALTGY